MLLLYLQDALDDVMFRIIQVIIIIFLMIPMAIVTIFTALMDLLFGQKGTDS